MCVLSGTLNLLTNFSKRVLNFCAPFLKVGDRLMVIALSVVRAKEVKFRSEPWFDKHKLLCD